jgi:hypothetical protein
MSTLLLTFADTCVGLKMLGLEWAGASATPQNLYRLKLENDIIEPFESFRFPF